MLNHKGTLTIETERLLLRKFIQEDAHDVFNNWATDPEVTQYLVWKPHENIDVTKEILYSWVKSYEKLDFYQWVIDFKECKKAIGTIGAINKSDDNFHCEIGYCIGKSYWNKGIMTEALKAVIRFLIFEIGYNRVQALHHTENKASGRVMLKAGMVYESRSREYHINNNGKFVDCDLYSVIRSDFK